MIIVWPNTVKAIVFISPNDSSGILLLVTQLPELESSRAAPTLAYALARGHDDGSQHKLPDIMYLECSND